LEILCVDDGSKDDSSRIIESYQDERITIIRQENQGPGTARNNGMDACTGEYILFFDSDDFLHPDMIKKMMSKIISERCSMAICKAFEFDEESGTAHPMDYSLITEYVPSGTFTFKDLGDKVLQFAIGWNWDKIYSSKLLKDNGIRYTKSKNSEDLMVAFPAIFLSERMCYVDDYLIYHVVDNYASVSRTRRKDPTAFIDNSVYLKRFLEDNNLFSDDVKRSYVNWFLKFALWHIDTLDDRSKIKAVKSLKKRGLKACSTTSKYGESYFFDSDNYKRLLNLERMPGFIFTIHTAWEHYSGTWPIRSIKKFLKG